MKKYLFLIFFLTFSSRSFPWWDTPHMAIAQIAYERLDPDVKKEVDKLSSQFKDFFSISPDFVTSSCWADDIAGEGFQALRTWHFSDVPYDPERILSEEKYNSFLKQQEGKDIIFAINQAICTLKNREAKPWAKAVMLRLLAHFVGDIHQPLHATTYFSKEFPCGDCGGNLFPICWEGQSKQNLHCFWDSGCGVAAERLLRPLNKEGAEKLNAFVKGITEAFPEDSFSQLKEMNFCVWRNESYQKAVEYTYNGICPRTAPSQEYVKRGQEVCLRQMALAGYRLARVLNSSLKAESLSQR